MSNAAAKMFARVTAKGIDYQHVPGGWAAITNEDVIGAISYAKIGEQITHLLYAKYCNDKQSRLPFAMRAQADALRALDVDGDIAAGIGSAVTHELVNAPICGYCKGAGVVLSEIPNNYTNCKPCKSTGLKLLSGRERARMAECPKSTWSRKIDNWVNEYVISICGYEYDACHRVMMQLRDSEAA